MALGTVCSLRLRSRLFLRILRAIVWLRWRLWRRGVRRGELFIRRLRALYFLLWGLRGRLG